jgi:hypothetical protein
MSILKNSIRVLIGLAFSLLLVGCANNPCCLTRVSETSAQRVIIPATQVLVPSTAVVMEPVVVQFVYQ